MKKRLYIILAFCLFGLFTSTSVALAQIPANYYTAANGKKGEALRTALNSCISNHTVLNYDALEQYYIPTDFRPDGTLWDVYSTCPFKYEDAGGTQNDFCQHWNKEHTVCQSWFGSGGMGSDLFQVLPTDARVNNLRSNWPYGETSVRNDNISKGAPYALGHLGSSSFSGYTGVGTVYEPDDRYKGDIARIYFYMATCYLKQSLNASNGATMFTYSGGTTGLTAYSVALLMKWHRNDPVSYKEIARNDSVYKQQGNRNPFVDFPELAEYIWGNKTASNFDLASILTAYSKEYVPLDMEGSEQTDYDKFGVNWFANGQKIQTDSVFKNHKLSELPPAPISCSTYSNTFVGWSNAAIAGKAQTPPSVLFTTPAEAPTINANSTFYAVFAHAEQGQGVGTVTSTAEFTDAAGYKSSSTTEIKCAEAGKVHIAFAQANAGNFAKYFTELRCYGGSTITLSGATISRVEFVPASSNDKKNALIPNVGSMDATGLIWSGSAVNIVFTVDGTSGYRGLSAIKVTYNDNTTVYIYSDYITSCDGSSMEVQHVQKQQPAAQKVLIDGKLYILLGEKIFTITGQEIK